MTKYTSNEQYEKDKDLTIAFCESTVIERTPAEIKKMKKIADLLNQSKWSGLIDDNSDWNDVIKELEYIASGSIYRWESESAQKVIDFIKAHTKN